MKRYIKLTTAIVLAIIVTACKKNDFSYPEGYVGSSKITTYATFTVNGDTYMFVPTGGTYTEPGVTAKEGDADLQVTTTGTVNTNAPGVYTLTYSAVNKDGFPASVRRTVVVATIAPDAAAQDLSGNYARTSNGSVSTWTKIAPGVYTVFNPGGAPGTNLTLVAINPTANELFVPLQTGSDGSQYDVEGETLQLGPPARYSWVIINPGYGTAERTFVKQ